MPSEGEELEVPNNQEAEEVEVPIASLGTSFTMLPRVQALPQPTEANSGTFPYSIKRWWGFLGANLEKICQMNPIMTEFHELVRNNSTCSQRFLSDLLHWGAQNSRGKCSSRSYMCKLQSLSITAWKAGIRCTVILVPSSSHTVSSKLCKYLLTLIYSLIIFLQLKLFKQLYYLRGAILRVALPFSQIFRERSDFMAIFCLEIGCTIHQYNSKKSLEYLVCRVEGRKVVGRKGAGKGTGRLEGQKQKVRRPEGQQALLIYTFQIHIWSILVPILAVWLSSDKTQVTKRYGRTVYPLYLLLGNHPSHIRRRITGKLVVGYLPTDIPCPSDILTADYTNLKFWIWHRCLRFFLYSLDKCQGTGYMRLTTPCWRIRPAPLRSKLLW